MSSYKRLRNFYWRDAKQGGGRNKTAATWLPHGMSVSRLVEIELFSKNWEVPLHRSWMDTNPSQEKPGCWGKQSVVQKTTQEISETHRSQKGKVG